MKIAIIGYGGVGKALVKLLKDKEQLLKQQNLELQLNYVIDYYGGIYNKDGIDKQDLINFTQNEKDITKYKHGDKNITLKTALQNKDIDLAIIMTPTNKETGEPGLSYIRELLQNKIHVVTSDKGPILLKYNELKQLADQNNVKLCIGCTTGGALPTVNAGLIDMAGAQITSIEGVLNGTTNFILKDMEENDVTYEEALKKAQEQGIAETNPTLDVEGYDTASKLLILTNVLMKQNKTLNDIKIQGITKLTKQEVQEAKQNRQKYKLVGKTENKNGQITMEVSLKKLNPEDLLYSVDGKNKAVKYTSDSLGDLVVIGGASGTTPAAASILRDIVNIHKGYEF